MTDAALQVTFDAPAYVNMFNYSGRVGNLEILFAKNFNM